MPKDKKSKKSDSTSDSDSGPDSDPPPKKKSKPETSRRDDEEPSWTLAKNKVLKVRSFKGKTYIDIREYYLGNNGDMLPGKKGISMTPEMWQKLKSVIDEVDDALKKY